MKEFNYQILVAIVNVILLGFICLFWLFPSVSPVEDDPILKLTQFCMFIFMFVLWAANYWLQYKSKKKKWYLPLAGAVLYVAIVSFFLLLVFPFINNFFIS
ncbi:hypothetical protein DVB69_00260 [Sporosarcina sp. BI001-red]|uniref:hypothetical protein n=1 Tax=Sporosarcina sp. BI001-red TaxID=2282866 RepID=UPI000E25A7DB|nr:hypothetical protein [Sporosarcina sp. BI001-red]REB11613.1 hypothetical protein DVB69_00260 [Sporosarcina sp. BI001-red]